MIYEVQITKENVKELIYKEMCRVALAYGGSPQEIITSIILPPSAYKLMEILAMDECRIQDFRQRHETIYFQGIPLLCAGTPFIMCAYSLRGWSYAHRDAKKMVGEIGGLDA